MSSQIFLITEKYNSKPSNIGFVLYPESAPADWLDILKSLHIPLAVSPLHDKDIEADGSEKKPHYHIIFCWPGPTTPKKVIHIVRDILNQPYPEDLVSVYGYFKYFTHADDPDKYQYDADLIQTFNGFDVNKFDKLTENEKEAISQRIEKLIDIYYLSEYSEICFLLREANKHLEYQFLTSHTLHFKTYLQSKRGIYQGKDRDQVILYETQVKKKMLDDFIIDDIQLP